MKTAGVSQTELSDLSAFIAVENKKARWLHNRRYLTADSNTSVASQDCRNDDKRKVVPMQSEGESHGGKPADVLRGKRAVIVEDEGLTKMLLFRMLTSAGLRVVGTADNASDGIDVVLEELPDIVLMDINMFGDFDGLDAAAALLKTIRVCIVVITAYSDDANRRRAEDIGACGYFIKPVSAPTLLPYLRKAFQDWHARGGSSSGAAWPRQEEHAGAEERGDLS